MAKIRTLVVDDATFMRRLLTQVLQTEADFEVVGTANDGEAALRAIPLVRPDIVTLDLEMPGLNGLATLARLAAEWPDLPVIVVSGADTQGTRVAQQAIAAGATDYVTKPSHAADLSAAFAQLSSMLLPRLRNLAAAVQHRKVLVADDGAVTRTLLRKMLRSLHCTVAEAADGEEAVARARDDLFDVIFMDSEMPRLNGCEAARCIRQTRRDPHSQPFIVGISATDGPEVRSACLASGMNDFMFKPFSLNFVRLMVSRGHSGFASVAA